MYTLILGMLLGSGLVLAFQELRHQIRAFKSRRLDADIKATIAMLNECTCWETNSGPGIHAYYCQLIEGQR